MKKILLILCLAVVACNPFKVIDPSDPRFDPYKFRFSDYVRFTKGEKSKGDKYYESELYLVIKELLKPGINEEKVDKILLNDPHVKKIDIDAANGKNYKNYIYKRWYMHLVPTPNKPGVSITVEYTEDGKLIKYTYKN